MNGKPPTIDPEDELTTVPEFDINTIVSPVMASRTLAPIVIPSAAADLNARLPDRIPETGAPLREVIDELRLLTDTYSRRNTHPGFVGYVATSGTPLDPLSHAFTAALNQNVVGYPSAPAAATIERKLIRWLCELTGYPMSADGVFLSGGSISNMTAIAAAMARKFGPEYRERGLLAVAGSETPVIICSEAAHFSIQRAAALLGIGTDNVIAVAVDKHFRMQPEALAQAMERWRCVLCVIGSAGTTTTGALDPLDTIADLCEQSRTWLHVDAAYGGGGLMSPELRSLYRGIERADSVTMDLHKWFYSAVDSSVVLYRDPTYARQFFYARSDYVQFPLDGPPEQHMFFHLGPELSRRFRALSAYMTFRHYGITRLGRNVAHNVECARYLDSLVASEPDLEVVVPAQLSTCNFRFIAPGASRDTVDRINTEIRARIEAAGHFLMSDTLIHGRPVLRACIVNHATRAHHIEGLVREVVAFGKQIRADLVH